MNRLLKTSTGIIALTMGAGVAMAQTDTGTTGAAGAMPSDITCAQIVDLDTQQAEQRLYFIAGFQAAQDAGFGTDSAAGATMGTDNDVTAGAESGAGTDPDTDTSVAAGTDADTGTTTEDGTGTDMAAGADTDTGADAELGTDTTTTAGTTADTGGAGAMGGGFFDIPVDTVMSECQNNPDMLVFDILSQQRGPAAP